MGLAERRSPLALLTWTAHLPGARGSGPNPAARPRVCAGCWFRPNRVRETASNNVESRTDGDDDARCRASWHSRAALSARRALPVGNHRHEIRACGAARVVRPGRRAVRLV